MAEYANVWNETGQSDFYQNVANAETGLNMLNNTITAYKTNKANKEIAHEANEYNYRIAMELATLQPELEYDLWLKQLNTNVYDAKMRQLATAGINPFVAAGKVANVQESALHAAAQQAPHATAFPYQPYYLPVDSVSGLAAAYQALSQSDMNKVATKRIGDLLAGEVEGQALDNSIKKFSLEMDIAFEGLERNVNVQKVKQDIKTSMELAFKYAEEGNLAYYQRYKEDSLRYLYSIQGKIEEKRFERIDEFINGELRVLDSQVFKNTEEGKAAQASGVASISQAALNDAVRATEDALRDDKVRWQKIENGFKAASTYKEFVGAKFELLNQIEDLSAKRLISAQQKAELEKRVSDLNYQHTDRFFDATPSGLIKRIFLPPVK